MINPIGSNKQWIEAENLKEKLIERFNLLDILNLRETDYYNDMHTSWNAKIRMHASLRAENLIMMKETVAQIVEIQMKIRKIQEEAIDKIGKENDR